MFIKSAHASCSKNPQVISPKLGALFTRLDYNVKITLLRWPHYWIWPQVNWSPDQRHHHLRHQPRGSTTNAAQSTLRRGSNPYSNKERNNFLSPQAQSRMTRSASVVSLVPSGFNKSGKIEMSLITGNRNGCHVQTQYRKQLFVSLWWFFANPPYLVVKYHLYLYFHWSCYQLLLFLLPLE